MICLLMDCRTGVIGKFFCGVVFVVVFVLFVVWFVVGFFKC